MTDTEDGYPLFSHIAVRNEGVVRGAQEQGAESAEEARKLGARIHALQGEVFDAVQRRTTSRITTSSGRRKRKRNRPPSGITQRCRNRFRLNLEYVGPIEDQLDEGLEASKEFVEVCAQVAHQITRNMAELNRNYLQECSLEEQHQAAARGAPQAREEPVVAPPVPERIPRIALSPPPFLGQEYYRRSIRRIR